MEMISGKRKWKPAVASLLYCSRPLTYSAYHDCFITWIRRYFLSWHITNYDLDAVIRLRGGQWRMAPLLLQDVTRGAMEMHSSIRRGDDVHGEATT